MSLIVATFIGWVSAEPLWLAAGHGEAGTVRVVAADAQCRGTFRAAGGAISVSSVDIRGLKDCAIGSAHPGQMASTHARDAYVDGRRGLVLRSLIGIVTLLACGILIAWVVGAFRLAGGRRLLVTLAGLGAPVALLVGFLALAY